MYGIIKIELIWFSSYMTNRRQIVTYNGKSSKQYPIKIDIPQGSNPGPVLFLLHVNAITQQVGLTVWIMQFIHRRFHYLHNR